MNTTQVGRQAEEVVALQLERSGYNILDRNWQTRYCEIDIVAQRGQTVYFVEVKYRSSSRQGEGLDYITPTKQKQMNLAVNFWTSNHYWQGDVRLVVASVGGRDIEWVAI